MVFCSTKLSRIVFVCFLLVFSLKNGKMMMMMMVMVMVMLMVMVMVMVIMMICQFSSDIENDCHSAHSSVL